MRLVGLFWLLSLIFVIEGVSERQIAWLLVAGAIGVVAFLLSVLLLVRKLVERGHR